MAVAQAQEVATRECLSCGGVMEQTQTICAKCRADLESHVMSASAPMATALVNITPAVTLRPTPPPTQPSVSLRPPTAPSPPRRVPAQPVGRLESWSRWQPSLIAAGLVVLAAGIAFVLWSFLTPPAADSVSAVSPTLQAAQGLQPPVPAIPPAAPTPAPVAQPRP